MSKPGKKGSRQEEMGQENMAGSEHTGSYLRKLRTEKGVSIKEACEATRISEINLKALEDQDFAALPAETFTRGLLNIYARYLEAEPTHVVARFMRERDQSQAHGRRGSRARQGSPHHILAPKKLAEPAHVSSITMAGVLLLCIVVLFTGFCLYTSWNPFGFLMDEADSIQSAVRQALPGNTSPEASTPVAEGKVGVPVLPEAETAKSATATEDAGPEVAAQAPETAGVAETITVEFLKDTRLILTRDNDKPVHSDFKKGEKQSWPLVGTMQLTFDQPESAMILANGRQIPFPAKKDGSYTLRLPAEQSSPSGQ